MALASRRYSYYESPSFALYPSHKSRKLARYWVIAPREEPLEWLAHGLLWEEALAKIEHMEVVESFKAGRPLCVKGPLTTGAELTAFRERLFPGVLITRACQRLAVPLFCDAQHIRHMEKGQRQIGPRMAFLLNLYGERYHRAALKRYKLDMEGMEDVRLLQEALTLENSC